MLVPAGQQDTILQLLIDKYRKDPQWFRSYLPEVAQKLEQVLPAEKKLDRASELTELERRRLSEALLQLLGRKKLTVEEATKALEYCASLIQDKSLPLEIGRKTILDLVAQATGGPVTKVTKNTRISVRGGEKVKEVAILMGVHLELTWDGRLVAISIFPTRFKERSKALKLVGIGKDSVADVSEHHDAYFAKAI